MEQQSTQILWLLALTILGLVQAVVLILKLTQDKNNKKKVPNNPSPPVDYHSHGERIATLEEAVDNVEKGNEKDHNLIRGDIQKLTNLFNRKIFGVLNGMRK